MEMQAASGAASARLAELPGSPLQTWGAKEWTTLGIEAFRWRMSQFLHGEQGALICTAKIVETVPWIDAKYYAATQVMDEARHVEVFSRYLDDEARRPATRSTRTCSCSRRRHRRHPLGHDVHRACRSWSRGSRSRRSASCTP